MSRKGNDVSLTIWMRQRRMALLWSVVVLTAVVFAVDVSLPLGANVPVLYVLPMLLCILCSTAQHSIVLAAAVTILIVVAGWVSPSGALVAAVLNRSLDIGLIWLGAALSVHAQARRRALEAGEVHRRDLLKQLTDIKYALDQSSILAITDRRGVITYANDKFCEIAKYSRDELIGQDHRIVNSAYHPKEFIQGLWRTIASGRLWRGEIRNRAKDGSYYWVDTTIVPFLDESGRPCQYMAIRNDITERKLAEQRLNEQAALTRLGQMAAVVAHEVKNPLAGVRGALQVIAGRLAPGNPDRGIINDILVRLDALNDLVNDLLLFARPRLPQAVRVSVRALLDDTVALLRLDAGLQNLSIEIEGDDIEISADSDQIKSVFLNLLLNAGQATRGECPVRVRLSQDGAFCEAAVIDQGPGVPVDVRERVFEPFFTTKHSGSGLGLSLARRLVDMHGGTIDLACPPSGGTTVRVRLPLTASRPEVQPAD